MPETGWIQTFTGRQFWPLDPRPEDVDLTDIAHALSMKCRYSGHCKRFYSVAEHAVLVSRLVRPEVALEALHHDDAEAYLPDVPRPIKSSLTGFKEIERKVEQAIATALNLKYPWDEEIHIADMTILADERLALMGPSPAEWHLPFQPAGVKIEGWDPAQAKWEFAKRHFELVRARS